MDKNNKVLNARETTEKLDEGAITKFAARLNVKVHFAVSTIFVSTPFGNWYVDVSGQSIKLYHRNASAENVSNRKQRFLEQYHQQDKIFENVYDVLQYIHDHDFNKIKRDQIQADEKSIFRKFKGIN